MLERYTREAMANRTSNQTALFAPSLHSPSSVMSSGRDSEATFDYEAAHAEAIQSQEITRDFDKALQQQMLASLKQTTEQLLAQTWRYTPVDELLGLQKQ
eukprot:m.25254 g.25254  ORF g.25254 m.25254 type:complete len:100 (-) comp11577_c0_seq2:836-1135(-)